MNPERHQVIKRVPLGDGHALLMVDVDAELLHADAATALRLAEVEAAMDALRDGTTALRAVGRRA